MLGLAGFLGLALIASTGCAKDDPKGEANDAIARGNGYAAKSQFREAAVEYAKAVQSDPRSAEARLKLAESHLEVDNLRAGIPAYYRAADLLPNDAAVQLRAAGFSLLRGQFEDAKTRAQRVLEKEPKNADALIMMANASAGLKDIDGAIRDAEEAIRIDPASAGAHTSLADFQLSKGDAEAAERAFIKAVELQPGSARALLSLASFYWASNRLDEADRTMKQALERNPDNFIVNRAIAAFAIRTRRGGDPQIYLQAMTRLATDSGTKLTVADYQLALGRSADAQAMLRTLADDPVVGRAARVRLAAQHLLAGRAADARREVDAVLKSEPKNTAALMMHARLLLAAGNVDEAATQAKAAIESNPTSAEAHLLYGGLQAQRGETAEARRELSEALRLNPRASLARLQLASLDLSRGALAEAAKFAAEALAQEPGNPTTRLLLARTLLASGDLRRAETELRLLITQHPAAAGVHASMGALLRLKQDAAGARRELTRALELDPTHLEALSSLIAIDGMSGRWPDALARVDQRLGGAPQNLTLLLLAARTHLDAGDRAGAESLLRRAIDAHPTRSEPYGLLAQLYLQQRKLPAARAEVQQILTRQPKSVQARTLLGMLYELDRMPAEAEKEYEAVLAIDARAPVAANNLAALILDRSGDAQRALDLAQTAKAQLPDDPHVDDTLGWAYYRKGLFPQAVAALDQSLAVDPQNAVVIAHLAMATARAGDRARSAQLIERVARIRPDLKELAEARETFAATSPR